jgi:hypothetical protein
LLALMVPLSSMITLVKQLKLGHSFCNSTSRVLDEEFTFGHSLCNSASWVIEIVLGDLDVPRTNGRAPASRDWTRPHNSTAPRFANSTRLPRFNLARDSTTPPLRAIRIRPAIPTSWIVAHPTASRHRTRLTIRCIVIRFDGGMSARHSFAHTNVAGNLDIGPAFMVVVPRRQPPAFCPAIQPRQ